MMSQFYTSVLILLLDMILSSVDSLWCRYKLYCICLKSCKFIHVCCMALSAPKLESES